MRPFFVTVGILAWILAFLVMWIFAESGGALTAIAAGTFAVVAILALGCERILKLLEDIRNQMPSLAPVRREVVSPAPAVVRVQPADQAATVL